MNKFCHYAVALVLFSFKTDIVFAAPQLQSSTQPPLVVRHPYLDHDSVYFERTKHFMALLNLVLKKSGENFLTEPVNISHYPASRNVKFLESGRYDVAWMHTSPEREASLRPIRIPIYRGLGGWRLLFISKQKQSQFENINTIEDLKSLIAGQGHDWPDTSILQKNSFTIRTSFTRDSLFEMLRLNRIDYFPRGINEIWDEIDLAKEQDLIMDSHLALRYPTAFYMFVRKEDEELAKILEHGFDVAIKDGSFKQLFWDYFGENIRKSNIQSRKVFKIPNPNLSAETPFNIEALWLNENEL